MKRPPRRRIARGALLAALALALALQGCSSRKRDAHSPYALPEEMTGREPGIRATLDETTTWEALAEAYYGDRGRARGLRRANRALGDTPAAGDRVFVPMDERERAAFEERATARAPYNRGLESARRGDYPAAILQFQEALRIDPRLARAQYNLGLVYLRAGRPAEAADALERAADMQSSADTHYALGSARLDQGDPRRAERAFRKAVDVDPWHLPSLYALARLVQSDDPREAAELWRRVLALDPHGPRGEEAARALGLAP